MGRLKIAPGIVPLANMYTAQPPRKTVDPIYKTKEHVVWRSLVLQRAGGRCEWVGEDGRRCGRKEVRMFADHIDEIRDGGALYELSNGQCLCGGHHTLKTNRVRARRNGFGA